MKRIMMYLMLIPLSLGLMTACTEEKTDVKNLEGKWTIIEVEGEKVEKEQMPFIEFNMETLKVHGNAGCNTFNSAAQIDPGNISNISLKPAAATMKACLDMGLEGKIFKTFERVYSIKAGENAKQMLILDKNNNILLTLSKQ